MARLRKVIRDAIISGPVPVLRSYNSIVNHPRTKGEEVVAFAHWHLIVPEGMMVGQRLVLEDFQIAFILAVVDNPDNTRLAYFSVGRRNGKTFILAVLLLAMIVGPLAKTNRALASGANSRDQAALIFHLMEKMLLMSPDLAGSYHLIPSSKKIFGLLHNVEYQALSADAKVGYGRALHFVCLDEASQIASETSDFVEMLETSLGSYDDSMMVTISTQSPSDASYLSIMLDAAEREDDPSVVAHVYRAAQGSPLMDMKEAKKANPGLGIFRSEIDLVRSLRRAQAIPAKEAHTRNLLLNQRVALEHLFAVPSAWKECGGAVNEELFTDGRRVVMGMDLSKRDDLTAAVLAAKDDDGIVHVIPYVFCPVHGIEERELRDKAPYSRWVQDGKLIPIGGKVMDYEQIVRHLSDDLEARGIEVSEIAYDSWRMDIVQKQAQDISAFSWAEWRGVRQGFQTMGPILDNVTLLLAEGKIRHGGHPLLNMAASNAIAETNAAGESKLAKNKSTQRIDPLVAMVMAIHYVDEGNTEPEFDAAALVG